jgi:hypothetical protein
MPATSVREEECIVFLTDAKFQAIKTAGYEFNSIC